MRRHNNQQLFLSVETFSDLENFWHQWKSISVGHSLNVLAINKRRSHLCSLVFCFVPNSSRSVAEAFNPPRPTLPSVPLPPARITIPPRVPEPLWKSVLSQLLPQFLAQQQRLRLLRLLGICEASKSRSITAVEYHSSPAVARRFSPFVRAGNWATTAQNRENDSVMRQRPYEDRCGTSGPWFCFF